MPEQPSRDGPPWPPRLAERCISAASGRRPRPLTCRRRRRARCRRPARRRAGRAPSAGRSWTSTGRSRAAPGGRRGRVVVEALQPSRSSVPSSTAVGQRPAVARLLAAEPDREQLVVGKLEEAPGRQADRRCARRRSNAACADASDTCCSRMMWSSVAKAGFAVPQRRRVRTARRCRRDPGPARSSSATAGLEAVPGSSGAFGSPPTGDRAVLAETGRPAADRRAALRAAQPRPRVLAERRPVVAALLEDDQAAAERRRPAADLVIDARSSARSRRSDRARRCRSRARRRRSSPASRRSPRAPGRRPRGSPRSSSRRGSGMFRFSPAPSPSPVSSARPRKYG